MSSTIQILFIMYLKLELSRSRMDLRMQAPFTCIIAASTGSGKTYFVKRLLENAETMINPAPVNIIYCYGQYQPLYDEMKRTVSNVNFIEGLPDDVNSYFDPRQHSILIIDDLSQELTDSIQLVNLFTKGSHHLNLSVIFICQNMFLQGKFMRTMSLNTHYFVVFRNARDKSQITHLARQMFPTNPKYLVESYTDATKEPYSYLLIDLKPYTEDNYRLRANIFPGETTTVYLPKEKYKK